MSLDSCRTAITSAGRGWGVLNDAPLLLNNEQEALSLGTR